MKRITRGMPTIPIPRGTVIIATGCISSIITPHLKENTEAITTEEALTTTDLSANVMFTPTADAPAQDMGAADAPAAVMLAVDIPAVMELKEAVIQGASTVAGPVITIITRFSNTVGSRRQ